LDDINPGIEEIKRKRWNEPPLNRIDGWRFIRDVGFSPLAGTSSSGQKVKENSCGATAEPSTQMFSGYMMWDYAATTNHCPAA
jgi:hypothetical protein